MIMANNDFRPVKAKDLKIIQYMNNYFATFDGKRLWRIEKWVAELLKMCNGKRTFSTLVKELSHITGLEEDKMEEGLKKILDELREKGFVVYL